jgi:hypothetical protein
MSRTLCPDCKSSDGLALYEDATYCHACHKTTRHKSLLILPKKKELEVPQDLTTCIPDLAHRWLADAGLYISGRDTIEVYWSPSMCRLVFPYANFAWMRSLTQKPKWLYAGPKPQPELYYLEKEFDSNSLVLCEDVISAIRISEHSNVIALMGTNITQYMLGKLKEILPYHQEILLWLDGDDAGIKARTGLKKQLQLITDLPVRIIRSKQDPKCFDSKTIKEILSI